MNIFNLYRDEVIKILTGMVEAGDIPAGLDYSRVSVELPKDASHGDMATNAAMVIAKPAGKNPKQLGDILSARLKTLPDVTESSVAGPGFVNFRLNPVRWTLCLNDILSADTNFGDSAVGHGQPAINIEYVSANPTGPLTAGHARGAVVGDALANLLRKAGYAVTKEYYINDAGAQVEKLARSTYLRYREALGEVIGEIPPGFYPGEYLKDVGAALASRDGDRWMKSAEAEWLPACKAMALAMLLAEIKHDLGAMGIAHDVFTSEQEMIGRGVVDQIYAELESKGLIYTGVLEPPKGKKPDDWEERPQQLFRATQFGDDVDRPLKKSDGSWTYFANDIAYHWDKYKRGGRVLVDVLGADHGGYVRRIEAAVKAITGGEGRVHCLICQLVHMFHNGEPVRMSKRAGTFVTLRDIIDQVGSDVLRFIMLTRRPDQTLEFDFAKVQEQSKDNPVFYVQYAHARCCSVIRNAHEIWADMDVSPKALAGADMALLASPDEVEVIRLLASWPRVVEQAAATFEPHRIAFFLQEVASAFHTFWNKGRDNTALRFLIEDNATLSCARLALVRSVATVIASGLAVMGVKPVEELRS